MYIYIDESGLFRKLGADENAVSCVAALVVPGSQRDTLLARYLELRPRVGITDHVTGGSLKPQQVAAVVALLLEFDAILLVSLIEMADHDDAELEKYKRRQADAFVAGITRDHHPSLVQELCNLSHDCGALSTQLFVQSVATTHLVEEVIRTATIYYSQRKPTELGDFRWIIDTKGNNQSYERLWSLTILPALQWRFMKTPLGFVKDFDYSAFRRFRVREMPSLVPAAEPAASAAPERRPSGAPQHRPPSARTSRKWCKGYCEQGLLPSSTGLTTQAVRALIKISVAISIYATSSTN
jgi:hypothetical protein